MCGTPRILGLIRPFTHPSLPIPETPALAIAFLVVLAVIWICWGWIGRIFLSAATLLRGLGWQLFQGARNDASSADDLGTIDGLLWAWLSGVALASSLRYRSRRRAVDAHYADGTTTATATGVPPCLACPIWHWTPPRWPTCAPSPVTWAPPGRTPPRRAHSRATWS